MTVNLLDIHMPDYHLDDVEERYRSVVRALELAFPGLLLEDRDAPPVHGVNMYVRPFTDMQLRWLRARMKEKTIIGFWYWEGLSEYNSRYNVEE